MNAPEIPYPPEQVIRFLTDLRLPEGSDAEEVFAAQTAAMLAQPWPEVGAIHKRLDISHGEVQLSADLVLPATGEGWPVLLYVHGGGWEAGSPGTHRRVACELAARGFATLVPRYRLGPAHRHPAQLDDLDAAIEWALENLPGYGADPTALAVAGDSAGAHLAAATAIRRRRAGREDVGAAIFLTGIFEYHDGLALCGPYGWDGDPATQPLLDPAQFESLRRDPVANPLLGAAELPPAFVGAGSEDPFAGQSRRLVEAMAAAGVAAELDPGPGLPHLWQLLPGLPAAAAGLDRAAAWAQARLRERKGEQTETAPSAPAGLVSHLIHTCIVCSDFERSLDFYTRVLGAKVGGRPSAGEAGPLSAAMGDPGRRRWRGAMLYWGDPARTSLVDLIAYDDDEGGDRRAQAPERGATDPGLSRLCLRVADLGAAADHLRAHGVELVSDPLELTIEGRLHRILFFRDPDGTLLEFSERVGRPHSEHDYSEE